MPDKKIKLDLTGYVPKNKPSLDLTGYDESVKKKVDSKPRSQEELWGSDSQPQDLYTSLVTDAQEPQQASDTLDGPPKMKTFTGLTPEEQQTLQAKPAPDYMVKKTIEDVNLSNQRQKKLEKDLITAKDKAPIVKELTDIKRKQSASIIAPIIFQVDAAHTVSEDSKKTIEDDYNIDVSGEGFWNNAKNSTYNILNEMVITPLNVVGSAVTGKGYGVVDEIVPYIKPEKPLQKYIDETIQDNKDKNISKADFDKQVKERYVKDKERNIIQSQLNTLNSTLTDREQKAFDFNAVDNISNLTDANKNILKNAKVLESARESVYNDVISSQKEIKYLLENKQQVPQELIDKRNLSGEKLDSYNNQLQDSYDSYNKNNKDLGTFAQEHEVFKTFGNSAIDFTERVKNSLISLEASGLDVGAYIADLGSGITDEKELGKQTASKLHDKAQELRKEVEYNSQFLKQQTEAVSAKDYLDKTTNFIGDNLVITAALMFGGEAGLAGMALQTTGDTYGKMVEEKKAGVKTGKDQYEPWQMALVPALWGATMVAPLAGQLATMNKTKRMLEAIAKDSPGLIEKTFAEKGYEFLKDYNVQSLKLAKDLTIMKGLQQTTNKIILGKDVEWDQFKGTDMLGEAYGLHAMNMGMPLVFGITTKPFFSSAEVKTMTKNSNDVFNLSQKLKDPNLSNDEKSIINNTIKDITTESKDIVSKKIGDMSKLPTVVSDMVYDAFGKSSDYRAEALRIKTSDNLSPAEKKLALDGLKKRFVENEDRLAKLRTGDVVSTLSADKQIDIKNKAQRMLIYEAKGKDIKLTDEQILDRANQIYIATETIKQEAKTAVEEIKPAVEVVKPTEEQILKDKLEGNLTTFTYKNKNEVPDAFKDKIFSEGEVNGEKFVRVTVSKLEADYELSKAAKPAVEEVAPAVEEVATTEVAVKPAEEVKVENNGIEYTKNEDGNWVNTKTGNEVKGIGETGKELIKTLDELSSPKTQAEQYSQELDQTKADNPEEYWSVSPVSAEDAAKGTIIDTPDGAVIVKPDGDIAGLFKKATSKAKGVAQDLLKRAVEAGGKKLDNYDGYLTKQYEKAGFRIVSRTPFNEEYALEGWNKEKHGTPDVVAMIYDPEGKLDIQEKTFNEYDDAIAYRDSFLKPSLEKEIEAIGKLFDESGRGFDESQVENAKKALEEIVPGVEWIIHDTKEAYKKAVGDDSKGYYTRDSDGNVVIHINKTNADGTTVAHEAFHAVLIDKILNLKDAQDITARMMKAVYKTASPDLRAKLDRFAEMYPDGIKNEERLAQLIGLISDGYKQMTLANKSIVKRWLDYFAKMIGRKPFTDNEVIDLLNTLATKVSTGEVISEEDIKIVKPIKVDSKGNLPEPTEESKNNLKAKRSQLTDDIKSKVKIGSIVSTRTPDTEGIHKTSDNIVDLKSLEKDDALVIKIAKELSSYGLSKIEEVNNINDARNLIQDFKNSVKDNLKFLHDSFGKEVRDVAKLWYDGANKISNEIADKYDYSTDQVAGVMAVLSPQMDWFRNLSLGKRVIDIYKNQQDTLFDSKMKSWVENSSSGTGKNKKPLLPDSKEIIKRVTGKKLSELDIKDKAIFIRAYDEMYNSKNYENISPNGDINGLVRNKNGSPGACGWGAFPTIEKSISILEDGSIENISKNLGNMHKVRNFFNNISNPNDPNAVTIDTHAVAAGLLLPLSGSSKEVLYNFGGASSKMTGSKGSYAVYADAYRELARELKILPRELQSITWEAVRGLFKADFKANKSNEENVKKVWSKYKNGEISIDKAHSYISDLAGGISKPVWYEYIADDNVKSLDENSAAMDQANEDLPTKIKRSQLEEKEIPAGNRLFNKPLPEAKEIADNYYKKTFGKDRVEFKGTRELDKENAKRISDAFIAMKHDPNNPKVKASYRAMARETLNQYKYFLKSGYKIEINNEEPYSNSEAVIEDLRNNKRIKIFSTESGFGDNPITAKERSENPLLKDSGYKDANGQPLLINDVFRAVHDFFGHAELGNSFGPLGEENAWNVHARMYSDLAKGAVTTETRGQNSYVNFSGVNKEIDLLREKARKFREEGNIEEADKITNEIYEKGKFADQKIGLLPEEFSKLTEIKRSQKDEKLIDNYVRVSRENGFSDAAVSAFLKTKGFSDTDIADAIALKKEKSNPFKAFFDEDVAPVFKSKAEAVYETGKAVVNALSPKTGVEKGVVSKFYELVGDRNKSNTIIDKQVKEYEDMFDRMSTTERVDFVDNMKAGKPQASPELDNVAKVISELDKDLYDEITKYKPNMAWKENHFRVLWKKIPGTTKEKFWSFMSKRPLRGSQGFMRQSTLTSMTEGIAKGGEPHSTNPITMFKLAYDDSMKYITSQRIIDSFKKDGVIKFVKSGGDVPEGYVKINDNVANIYFKSDTGMVKTGEYWIQEGPGRMLNNMLSRDLIRDTKLGESLMGIKNLYTQVELGLSPFHAVAITLEQIASGMGIGARKIFNLGDVTGGIKDILEAPFSPKSTFSLGRDVFKFATVKDFENSEAGKKLLERMPNAKEYIGDFFQGGGLMKQHDELKSNTYKALKEQVGKDNYIGAALRALPAINEGIMSPLFNVYIPTLKIGLFMREFPLVLAENKSRLESGKVTREELSRKVVDSVDNRLGEMNFDNLYWNKTFKTATQFMLRSVTWKLGNIRQMGMAPVEQAMEFIDAAKEGRRPNLSPKMAWLFGLSLTQVVISSIMQHLYLDDDDKNKDIKDFKDIVAPRINSADNKERVVIPTYYKDLLHFWHAPAEYVTSGVSGPLGKGIELYKNVDFYGYEIRDENDPATKQLIDAGKYVMPKPFSISSFQKMKEKGEPFNKQALSFLGFNKAPGYLEQSEIESEIIDLYRIRNTSVKPIKQKEGNDAKKEIRKLYKTDKEAAQKLADSVVDKGILKPTQITYLFRNVGKNDDAGVYFFSRLPSSDKEYLYSKMSKEDKERFDPKGNLLSQEEKDAKLKIKNPKVYAKIMAFRARRKNAQ